MAKVVATQIIFMFTSTWGRWTHFDEDIFQMGRNHQLDTVYDIAVFQGRMWQTCNAQVYRSMLTADYPQARSKSEVVTTSVICGGLNWIISFLTRAWNEHRPDRLHVWKMKFPFRIWPIGVFSRVYCQYTSMFCKVISPPPHLKQNPFKNLAGAL